MDVKQLFKTLRKEAECPVCLETVKEPKTLPCLHSFCLQCLDKLAGFARRQLQTTINCPVCLARFQIPEGDTFNELPASFHLNRLVDILSLEDGSKEAQRCSSCEENNTITCYCFVCQGFMCSACFEAHQRIKATRNHRSVLIEKLQAKDVGELIRRPAMCSQKYHENEALEYYCKECKGCICMKCGFASHNGHTMVDIQQAAEERKLQIASIADRAKAQMAVFEEEIETQNKLMNRSTNEMRAAQDRVTETVEELVRVLREHEKITKKKLAEVNEIQTGHHATQVENVRSAVSHLKRSVEYGEGILQRNIAHEILQPGNTVIGRLEELLNTPETEVCKGLHFAYILNKETIHAFKSLGLGQAVASLTDPSQCVAEGNGLKTAKFGTETNFTVTTNNSEGNQHYNEEDRVTVEIRSLNRELEVNIVNYKDGSYKVCYTPKHVGQHDIFIEVNGKSLSDGPWSFRVERSIYHCKAEFSSWSKEGNLQFPCSIAQCNKSGNIAVADYERKQVLLFDSQLKNVKTTLKLVKTKPRSVAFSKASEIIVVHEQSSNSSKISVFTELGQFVKNISTQHLVNPCSVSVRDDGLLIVCDSGDLKVKILSAEGDKLENSFGVPHFDAFPWFAVHHERKYFVSYRMAPCVKVFNEQGVSLYDIESSAYAPVGLTIDKFNNLIVCDAGNKRVQVFTLRGEFLYVIHKFGKSCFPCSVAVTTYGDIMVSEITSKSIYIFQKSV